MATTFNKDNLEALMAGFSALYGTWLEVAVEKEKRPVMSISDLINKLDSVTQANWQRIKEVFVKDASNDRFQKHDEGLPCKLLADLVSRLDLMNNTAKETLKELYCTELEQKKEIHSLQSDFMRTKEDLVDARRRFHNCETELQNIRGNISHLETLNQEKTATISQLQRDATVELWEKEKRKILEKAKTKEEEYKTEGEELRKTNFNLRERLQESERELKKMKIMMQVKVKPGYEDLEEQKKYSFLLEKDVRRLDEELFMQQKLIAGLLNGLKYDYWLNFRKFQDDKDLSTLDPGTIRETKRIGDVIEEASLAAVNAELKAFSSGLSSKYTCTDRDIKFSIVKKLYTQFNGRKLPLVSDKHNNTLSTDTGLIHRPNNPNSGLHKDANGGGHLEKKKDGDIVRRVSAERQVAKPSNPQLINPVTLAVDMMVVLKHVPFMSKSDIEDHWSQFSHYDKDGDGSLDLAEVMTGISTTFGATFSASQIQEAIVEVDCDHSGDLDFFEFVMVANLLRNRGGRSDIYKSKVIQDRGRAVSKTCAVM